MTKKNLEKFLRDKKSASVSASSKPSSGGDLGQFLRGKQSASVSASSKPSKPSKPSEPSTSEEFLVPVEEAATAPKATIVALKAVKDYTDEDLVHPERVLLQQTGDALTRIQKETQDVWWKDARSEEYTEIGQERVPTPGRGRVFPTTEHRATGNQD